MPKPTIDLLSGRPMLHAHSPEDITGLDYGLLSNLWYGIRRMVGQTSPTFTRIGNADLHKVSGGLPIQNKMRRCLVLPDKTVNYYLDPDNSNLKSNGTAADLTGTDGHVMVEIPEHYARGWYETVGADIYENYAVSEYPLPGFNKIEKHYISAYEASINRSTGAAASVVNLTTDYRGGNNNSALDAAPQTLLGKPVTNLTRAQERAAAALIGAGWCEEPFEFFSPWRILLYIEYATTNLQTAINHTPTVDGYKQGGLGIGVTDAVSAEWNTFNAYNPFIPCGATNSIGNRSDENSLTITDFKGAGINQTFKANSYRGIENPFGHIWKRIDGINIQRAAGQVLAYGKKGVTGFVDDTAVGYDLIGLLPYTSNYILDTFLVDGIILPKTIAGGSTTGFCDYFYAPGSDAWRAPRSSGSANSVDFAGVSYVAAAYSAAYATASLGFRLCVK